MTEVAAKTDSQEEWTVSDEELLLMGHRGGVIATHLAALVVAMRARSLAAIETIAQQRGRLYEEIRDHLQIFETYKAKMDVTISDLIAQRTAAEARYDRERTITTFLRDRIDKDAAMATATIDRLEKKVLALESELILARNRNRS